MNHAIRGSLFRILRVTVLVLVLIAAATWLRNILTSLESEQAVINAEIIEIRTPITGVLEINDVRPGMLLEKGKPLFRVENPRFGDRETVAQFNTLQTLVESLRAELASARRELEVAGVEQERARRLYKAQVIARVEKELAETRTAGGRQNPTARSHGEASPGNGSANDPAEGVRRDDAHRWLDLVDHR